MNNGWVARITPCSFYRNRYAFGTLIRGLIPKEPVTNMADVGTLSAFDFLGVK